MESLPVNSYVELRNGGYYVAGTRIGLDVIVHEFESGKSPESILEDYPPIGTLAKMYGVLTFILQNPGAVAQYLEDQDRLWEEIKQQYPMPPEMLKRIQRARELSRKPS